MPYLSTIRTRALGALSCGALTLLFVPAALAGDIVLEATGTVVTANPSGGGVFGNVVVGDAALVHLEVFVPGFDVVPGQFTNYMIDGATSFVEIGGVRDGITGAAGAISITVDLTQIPNRPGRSLAWPVRAGNSSAGSATRTPSAHRTSRTQSRSY